MGRKLYISNLAFEVTRRGLDEVSAQAGDCESMAIITDGSTGQSQGFGIEMASNR